MDGTSSVAAHLSLVRRRPASTGLIALLTTAVDALVDVGEASSPISSCGTRIAGDREHRFGREKGEAVAEVGPASVLEIVEGGDEAVERTQEAVKRAPGSASPDAPTFAFRLSRRREYATVCVASCT
jgi:hypothetical protein